MVASDFALWIPVYLCHRNPYCVYCKYSQKHTRTPVLCCESTKPIIQKDSSEMDLRVVEVCSRIDGCPIVNGICETCEIVKR